MRISDWSSDVCSSDLIDEPFADALNEVLAYSVDRIPRDYRSESPFDKMVGEYMIDETGADVALMPGVGYRVSIYPGNVTRDRLYTLLPHPAKVVTFEMKGSDLLAVLRSEEHTSELQSLMRISYAVFCLKKK